MKALVTAVMLAFASFAVQAAEPAKKEAVQNENCVKKDKNGKCPPLPNSSKPTPKKSTDKK